MRLAAWHSVWSKMSKHADVCPMHLLEFLAACTKPVILPKDLVASFPRLMHNSCLEKNHQSNGKGPWGTWRFLSGSSAINGFLQCLTYFPTAERSGAQLQRSKTCIPSWKSRHCLEPWVVSGVGAVKKQNFILACCVRRGRANNVTYWRYRKTMILVADLHVAPWNHTP